MSDTPAPNFDPDSATIPLSGPRPTLSGSQVDLPLPEELAKLLPAGAYDVTSFLGAGGMGAVYKGTQIRLKRPVAIKIMRRDMGKDHDFEARFEREAQAMAKLNHPNIISVIDFGEAGPDYLFIVMELVDGTDLMDVIRSKQMTQEMALTLLPQICDALQFAHDHGIVHRDIKPNNIMLTRDGRVKMADFGLAKHFDHAETGFRTQTGTGMGTPDYAAPEQFDPTTQIDHRADIYALGVMIYQMITGALPRGVWRPPSQRAPVSTQWDAVVSRAMQNDPADRYQKASEVKTELSSIPLVANKGSAKDGSADTPVRPSSNGGAAAKTDDARKSGRAPLKSRTPFLVGIAAGVVVIATVVFFALRKPDEGRAAAPPAAANSPTTTKSPDKAALAGASALPESGWQPLFTDAEWRTNGAGHEFKDGVVHLSKGWRKPQPSADGALRARFRFSADSKTPSVVMRQDVAKGTAYVLGLSADGQSAYLNRWGGAQPIELVKRPLPKPAQPGATITLELRIQGDHLAGLINGTMVVETQDASHQGPGEWGISADNALFESVEVQPLPASAEPWQNMLSDPAKLRFTRQVEQTGEGLHLSENSSAFDPSPEFRQRDGAVRLRAIYQGGLSAAIRARASNGPSYQLYLSDKDRVILLRNIDYGKTEGLANYLLKKPLQPGQDYELELRAVGPNLTATLNGEVLGTVNDANIQQGNFGIAAAGSGTPVLVKAFDFLDLDKPAVSPSPSLPVSKSSDPKFPPGQWVKLFTKPEDLPADLRKADSGVTWEDGWISSSKAVGLLVNSGQTWSDAGIRFRARVQDQKLAPASIRDVVDPDKSAVNYQVRGTFSDRKWRLSFFSSRGGETLSGDTLLGEWPARPEDLVEGKEHVIELAAVKDRIVVRIDTRLLGVVSDARLRSGRMKPFLISPVRDIEVINLDGLPEAEALRLLGVDEKGNDLRGKSAASPATATQNASGEVWEDLIKAGGWDAPWKIENGILTRPSKTKVERKWTSTFAKDGALRVTRRWDAAWYDLHMMMRLRGPRLVNVQFPEPKDNKIAVLLTVERATGKSNVTGGTKKSYQRGDIITIEFRAVGENLTVSIDGETVATARDEAPIAGSYAIVSDYSDAPAIHRVEFLNLDGKATTGASAANAGVPASKSSVATATKDAPFTNTLGMKFVPVPITGGPTDKQRVLFSVWETRVQDYEAFAKETKRERPKAPFEQGPTHPAVMVSWEDATAFCAWLTEQERKAGKIGAAEVYRLPSDHEWSCAVGIGNHEDGNQPPGTKQEKVAGVYPWGTDWPPPAGVGNYHDEAAKKKEVQHNMPGLDGYNDGWAWTAPVGSFPPNGLGLHDLSGNAGEWCEDWISKQLKAVRGGLYSISDRKNLLSSYRMTSPPETRNHTYGFRIVLASGSAASKSASFATKNSPFTNTLGMKFVPVPGTKALFSIWDTRVMDYAAFAKAQEAAGKKVDASWKTQQKDGVPVGREPDHPVVGVSWEEAQAFCAWLTVKDQSLSKLPPGMRYRLPSDEEWSWAAGMPPEAGATPEEKHGKNDVDFPWGKDFPPTRKVGNYADETFHAKFPVKRNEKENRDENLWIEGYDDGYAMTSPVGSFPANAYGLYDMGGNVWQWCEDWWNAEHKDRVLRGASWVNFDRYTLRSSYRNHYSATTRNHFYGFRCVLEPAPSAAP